MAAVGRRRTTVPSAAARAGLASRRRSSSGSRISLLAKSAKRLSCPLHVRGWSTLGKLITCGARMIPSSVFPLVWRRYEPADFRPILGRKTEDTFAPPGGKQSNDKGFKATAHCPRVWSTLVQPAYEASPTWRPSPRFTADTAAKTGDGERSIIEGFRHNDVQKPTGGRPELPRLGQLDARLWEVTENLHRADLDRVGRSEHAAEWVRITDEIAAGTCLCLAITRTKAASCHHRRA